MAKKKPATAESPFISLPPGERALWKRRADPRVRDILLAIAELTRAEGDHLCLWLQYYLHPHWVLVPAREAERLGGELVRVTELAQELRSRIPRKPRDEAFHKVVLEIRDRGFPKKCSAQQIANIIHDEPRYEQWRKNKADKPLTRGNVQKVLNLYP